MKASMYIGSTPPEEDCAQVGQPGYDAAAIIECTRYIAQLREQFGLEPEGARLYIKSNPHDFGTYYEVCCEYDDEIEASGTYAFKCEGEAWPEWHDKEPA
jgi:hypothetical protein